LKRKLAYFIYNNPSLIGTPLSNETMATFRGTVLIQGCGFWWERPYKREMTVLCILEIWSRETKVRAQIPNICHWRRLSSIPARRRHDLECRNYKDQIVPLNQKEFSLYFYIKDHSSNLPSINNDHIV
jgi:hypothetical protein